MPQARKRLVCPETTRYYHCMSRCVRRAFLCGQDPNTGADLSHRKARIEALILKLAHVFALDICAYAVMSNHYHVVLHVDVSQAQRWSLAEVVYRWHQVFRGTALSQRFLADEVLMEAEIQELEKAAELWRTRLCDLSWYMRVLNERIAREANKEEDCTGRFWEGRFKSQALLDEKALLACMAYVDLNPVRAGSATSPETSAHTSIQKRLHREAQKAEQPSDLAAFSGQSALEGLPFSRLAYFQLIDWTSRKMQEGKGSMASTAPPLLQRLGIESHQWWVMTHHFESNFKGLIGSVAKLRAACARFEFRYCTGVSACQATLGA